MTKYRLIRDFLSSDGSFEFECAQFAEPALIELAHDPSYVQQFLSGSLPQSAMRRIGFPWSSGLVQRTLGSVGGTLCATREAFNTGWGGNLAGGTHHAFRAEGAGFCVFNDIAVALLWARRDGAGSIRRSWLPISLH